MQEFAEEYVANLQPRDERYDTRLGDDFYVSTFPNGVKTWIFLYDVNGYSRRQTLGVYPEMPLARALETLYAARRTRSVENELMDQGLDGSSQLRKAEDSPIDLTAKAARAAAIPRPGKGFMLGAVAGTVVGAIVAGGALWLLRPAAVTGEVRLAAAGAPVVSRVAETPAAAEALPAAGATMPAAAESVAEPDAARPGADTLAAAAPAESAAVQDAAAPRDAGPDGAAITGARLQTLGESQRQLIELQRDMAGTLAWSQLTSGIVHGEPVDDLGWQIQLTGEPRRVFFFVRVRGMSGSTVYYRWTYEGTVIKRDTVRVGEGWHSPAFSSVTLTPEREGAWQVEVMDSEGKSLGVERFRTSLDRIAALTGN